jgi:dolichyl-phosphate beta-glucosyltransferase
MLTSEELRNNKIQLSVVIPCYNEYHRIGKTIEAVIDWAQARDLLFELIIADDGSTDETLNRVKNYQGLISNLQILALPHQGKGAAVRSGMLAAQGKEVLFMDADGSAPLVEIDRLRVALKGGCPIVIGSRVIPRGSPQVVQTSLYRKLIGRCYAFLVNLIILKGIQDTQCGLKLFRRDVVMEIFPVQKLVGFAFDVEILYLARKKGFAIKEIPINWVNQKDSKVNVFKDSWKMFWDVQRIPFLHSERRKN